MPEPLPVDANGLSRSALRDSAGPDRVMHYNGFLTAEINGAAEPGYSSGQAEAAMERLLRSKG